MNDQTASAADGADDGRIRNETIRFLIEQKVSFVNSAVNVCMAWWVSSIVFCGGILAAVWSSQDKLRNPVLLVLLGIILLVFFASIAAFGVMVIFRLDVGRQEIARLAVMLNFAESGKETKPHQPEAGQDFFHAEIKSFQIAMSIGAVSFGFTCVVWVVFWFFLWSQRA